jgi:hypothetical protein
LAGFLPPNDASGRGEGFVTFFIDPAAGLADGAPIANAAEIVFDTNAPIVTEPVRNAVDGTAPTSSVAALPAHSPTPFTVRWSGEDGQGAGVVGYDIYVAENGGAFTPWLRGVTTTSAPFTGEIGMTYAFYSVAVDAVGHRQAVPTAAQAQTTIGGSGPALYLPYVQRRAAARLEEGAGGLVYLPFVPR